jgi:hypothetical protein
MKMETIIQEGPFSDYFTFYRDALGRPDVSLSVETMAGTSIDIGIEDGAPGLPVALLRSTLLKLDLDHLIFVDDEFGPIDVEKLSFSLYGDPNNSEVAHLEVIAAGIDPETAIPASVSFSESLSAGGFWVPSDDTKKSAGEALDAITEIITDEFDTILL